MATILADWTKTFNSVTVLVKYFQILELRQQSSACAADTYPTEFIRSAVLDTLLTNNGAQNISQIIPNYQAVFDAFQIQHDTMKQAVVTWFENLLALLGQELRVSNVQRPELVLDAIALAMKKEALTISTNTVALASADIDTAPAAIRTANNTDYLLGASSLVTNVGNGKAVIALLGDTALRTLAKSEIATPDILSLECLSNGSGSDTFQIFGSPKQTRTSYKAQGAGNSSTIRSAGNSLINGAFDNWSSATPPVPNNFNIVTGAWGTELLQETVNKYKGTYALKGITTSAWKYNHAVTLTPNKTWCAGMWIKKSATNGSGSITMRIVDSAGTLLYTTNAATNLAQILTIDISNNAYSNWAFVYFVFQTLGAVDSTARLEIATAGLTTVSVYMDHIQCVEMTSFNQLQFAVFNGSIDFGAGDRFGFGGADGEDYAGFKITATGGTIQEFIGRMWGKQLPSEANATADYPNPALTEAV
jgi:hypothetical protein